MGRETADEPIDLLLRVVEMRRAAKAAFAEGDFSFVIGPQRAANLGVIVARGNEADDAAPLVIVARADDLVAPGFQAGDEAIRQQLYPLCNRIDSRSKQQLDGGFERK